MRISRLPTAILERIKNESEVGRRYEGGREGRGGKIDLDRWYICDAWYDAMMIDDDGDNDDDSQHDKSTYRCEQENQEIKKEIKKEAGNCKGSTLQIKPNDVYKTRPILQTSFLYY